MSTQFASRFLCTKKAAQLTGLSHRTLEKYRRLGTGPTYSKVGGRILYATSDVLEWIGRCAKRSTSDLGAVRPAKPVNHVRRIDEPADEVHRAEPVPDSTIVVELIAAEGAKPRPPEAAHASDRRTARSKDAASMAPDRNPDCHPCTAPAWAGLSQTA